MDNQSKYSSIVIDNIDYLNECSDFNGYIESGCFIYGIKIEQYCYLISLLKIGFKKCKKIIIMRNESYLLLYIYKKRLELGLVKETILITDNIENNIDDDLYVIKNTQMYMIDMNIWTKGNSTIDDIYICCSRNNNRECFLLVSKRKTKSTLYMLLLVINIIFIIFIIIHIYINLNLHSWLFLFPNIFNIKYNNII